MGMCLGIAIKAKGFSIKDMMEIFPDVNPGLMTDDGHCEVCLDTEGSYSYCCRLQDDAWNYAHMNSTEQHPIYMVLSDYEEDDSFFKIVGNESTQITAQEYGKVVYA